MSRTQQLHVAKLGGSSQATAERTRTSVTRIFQDERRMAITISAMGGQNKITDDALAIARHDLGTPTEKDRETSVESRIERIVARHQEEEKELCGNVRVSQDIGDLITQRRALVLSKRRVDSLASIGELMQAQIVARFADQNLGRAVFVNGERSMIMDEGPNGNPFVPPSTYPLLAKDIMPEIEKGTRVIFSGYHGRMWNGDIRVFDRGGSDLTAAILSVALSAALHENFTDVHGIGVVDYKPLLRRAPILSQMGLEEAAELTLGGSFGVIMDKAVGRHADSKIPVRILHALEDGPGTMIIPDNQLKPEYVAAHPIRGIAFRPANALIAAYQYDMGQDAGYLYRLSGVLARLGISVDHMPTSQIGAAVIASEKSMGDLPHLAEQIQHAVDANRVSITRDLGLISIVGNALPNLVGFAGEVFTLLGNADIGVKAISYLGGNNLTLGVANGHGPQAMELLFNRFFGQEGKYS